MLVLCASVYMFLGCVHMVHFACLIDWIVCIVCPHVIHQFPVSLHVIVFPSSELCYCFKMCQCAYVRRLRPAIIVLFVHVLYAMLVHVPVCFLCACM